MPRPMFLERKAQTTAASESCAIRKVGFLTFSRVPAEPGVEGNGWKSCDDGSIGSPEFVKQTEKCKSGPMLCSLCRIESLFSASTTLASLEKVTLTGNPRNRRPQELAVDNSRSRP